MHRMITMHARLRQTDRQTDRRANIMEIAWRFVLTNALRALHRLPRLSSAIHVMTKCMIINGRQCYVTAHRILGEQDIQLNRNTRMVVPPSKLCMVVRWTFQASGLRIWNDLPEDFVSAPSMQIFRRRLKAQLFRKSHPDILIWQQCWHLCTGPRDNTV